MNRKERRLMQRDLGLNKHYKKETRKQKWERWRDNQENGKRMMEDMKEQVRIMQNMTAEEKESQEIAFLAQKISSKKEIPLIDAMVEAREEYVKSKK
jgi:hypothetical protein